MADETLRRNLDSAFDPGPGFPHPSLVSRAIAMLDAEAGHSGRRRAATHPTWILPMVAALLALAIVATLVLAARGLHPQPPIPVRHPQIPTKAGCDSYQPGSVGPKPVKAVSPTTIWAQAGLLSTDGGAHWHDTSPSAMRMDEPAKLPKTDLPPDFAEFYLDADHAWVARSYNYGSKTACYDHIATLQTTDGGRTWRASAPITRQPSGPPLSSGFSLQVFFVDAQHGWLLVDSSAIYSTSDGGQGWRLISANTTAAACYIYQLTFVSGTKGWATCDPPGSGSAHVRLATTNDAGATWTLITVPDPPGGCSCSTGVPVFIDPMRGVTGVVQDIALTPTTDVIRNSQLSTSDGGSTWRAVAALPGTWVATDFADANNLWELVTQPGWHKGGATRDSLYHSIDTGATWTLVQRNLPIAWQVETLQFVDAQHGFVVELAPLGNLNGPWRLGITADGGHTWTVIHPVVS